MFDLPLNPMMLATAPPSNLPAVQPVYAEVFNAADLDVGYEVAFPFLTSADDREH
jgi:hypothetical protein